MNEILIQFVLPILTALIAWFGNAYRNKQKRESDILANVERMFDMNDKQVSRLNQIIERYETRIDAMEARSAHDREAIKQARVCKVPSDDCPVLQYDAMWVDTECNKNCAMCAHNSEV